MARATAPQFSSNPEPPISFCASALSAACRGWFVRSEACPLPAARAAALLCARAAGLSSSWPCSVLQKLPQIGWHLRTPGRDRVIGAPPPSSYPVAMALRPTPRDVTLPKHDSIIYKCISSRSHVALADHARRSSYSARLYVAIPACSSPPRGQRNSLPF